MSIQRPALGREDGFSMYIVVMAMMVLLTLGAALSVAGHRVLDGGQRRRARRARASGRRGRRAGRGPPLNLQQPADAKCITTTAVTRPAER